MAQSFARLGSRVTLVEQLPRLLAKEDVEISELLQRHFEAEGIELRLGCRALRFQPDGTGQTLVVEAGGQESAIAFDTLLVAAGRAANTEGLGLEALGIATTPQHTVETDEFLRTAYPNVYACGDAVGPYQFTHLAAHQAWYATVNGLFGGAVKFRVDDSVIPWATFTDPEVARVGLNEQQALEKGIAHEVTVYDLAGLDRAITEGEAEGFVKLLTAPGSDRILGVTIAGPQAGDLIAEWVLAMKHRIGLNRLLRTVHVYPTLTEANRNAAGVWRRNHTPAGLLRLAERYHAWRRG
jgi:pyruvate/2-oxoglutarate dehydrogenase complex dihydrolipoamide dehydrogenase (E3) component